MPAQTFDANAVARAASKAAGRTVTDKQVRGLARATIKRFDKVANPAYQSHHYTASERDALVRTFVARAKGRTVAPAKAPRKPRAKATPVAKVTPDA